MTIYLQITSGRGPEECGWVVAQLLEALRQDAHSAGLAVELIDVVQAAKGAFRSVILALHGDKAEAFATPWQGVVQWIGASMFHPHHKRKNWFVGISRVELESGQAWNEADVRVEVMRASGPGGQHVNKTCSAVRATHVPTGLSAISQTERSQSQNRKMALLRLRLRLRQKGEEAEGLARQQRWDLHNQLERGNPVRVYEGPNFRLVRSKG